MQSVTVLFRNVLDRLAPLLRGLGFGYLNTLGRGWLARENALAQPKKVLSGSMWHAAGRKFVHVLPLTVLGGLIWLNYRDYFIGPTFIEDADKDNYFMAGIQLCAKLEELLCVASLSAIVLQALRDQVLGDGVPMGLLGSGVWFSSLSAFWSADFLGSWKWIVCESKRRSWRQIWRRCRFYLLLILCGAIAVTIGPASAILMIPRQQDLFAGGLSFYLNGTYSDSWPNTVYAHTELDLCSSVNATEYSVCASEEYSSLLETWSAFEYDQYCPRTGGLAQYAPSCQARGVDGNREWDSFVIHNKNSLMPPVLNAVRGRTWSSRGFAAVQPRAATVAMIQQKKAEWYDKVQDKSWNYPNTRQFRWTYDTAILGHATSPFVRVRCTEPQNLTADADFALFPFIANRSDVATSAQSPRQRPTIDWDPQWKQANISQLDHSRSAYLRTQWLPLPMQDFGHPSTGLMTTGLLLELPWNGTSRAAVGCAVAAAWHNVTVSSRTSANYDAWNVAFSPNDYLDMDDSPDSIDTNTPVGLDLSWLVQLTPTAPVTALTPAD
ncbi:hypothetical protein B0A48_00377 [Cryoendolithus antarcticus]|uniref:Uncharacterized protein n=1 Tax=Cryoendolithus antarcticus TaxID=1507870 RepID=A0A1V8TUB7_9PEZI|nr:hypothetical protein B0A48_00377 [Cryoendolithus antarcticus]